MMMDLIRCERKNHKARIFDIELILLEIKKQMSKIKTALKEIVK